MLMNKQVLRDFRKLQKDVCKIEEAAFMHLHENIITLEKKLLEVYDRLEHLEKAESARWVGAFPIEDEM